MHSKVVQDLVVLSNILTSSVTSVGDSAFYGLTQFSSIDISHLTSIGSYAFYGCSGLTAVNITSSMTDIGYEAFGNCGLTSVTRNATAATSGKKYNLQFGTGTASSLTTFSIPKSITSISAGTLTNFGSLQTLYIPFVGTSSSAGALSSVFGTNSYTGSYYVYQGLYPTNITLGTSNNGVPPNYYIYDGGSFVGEGFIPSTLKNVYVTNQTALRDCAFQYCTSIQNVYNGSGSKVAWTSIGNATFDGCTSLTYGTGSCTFSSLTSVGIAAFRNCSNLKAKFTMKKVTYFGVMCFSGTQLNQLTLDTNKTYKTTGYGTNGSWTFTSTAGAANITISNATTNATNVKYSVPVSASMTSSYGWAVYAIRQN